MEINKNEIRIDLAVPSDGWAHVVVGGRNGIYHSLTTGMQGALLEVCGEISREKDSDVLFYNTDFWSNVNVRSFRMEYDEQNDIVVLFFCEFDLDENRFFVHSSAVITRDKKCFSDLIPVEGNPSYAEGGTRVLKSTSTANLMFAIKQPRYMREKDEEMWAFRKMWGSMVLFFDNHYLSIDTCNQFISFMGAKGFRKLKASRESDAIIGIPLAAVTEPPSYVAYVDKVNYTTRGFARIERIDGHTKPLCVLRTFFVSDEIIVEGARVYASGEKIYKYQKDLYGSYKRTNFVGSPLSWDFTMEIPSRDIVSGTAFEHIIDVFEDVPFGMDIACKSLYYMLQYPILEQMCKINELKWFMLKVFRQSKFLMNPLEVLKQCFGVLDLKAGTIWGKIGINRYQAKKFIPLLEDAIPEVSKCQKVAESFSFICLLKMIGCGCDFSGNLFVSMFRFDYMNISHLDRKSSDELFNIAQGMMVKNEEYCTFSAPSFMFSKFCHVLGHLTKKFGLKNSLKNAWVLSRERRNARVINNFNDYYSICHDIGVTPHPFFLNEADITNAHNDVMNRRVIISNSIKMEKWKDSMKKSRCYEWEYEDDSFMSTTPREPIDVVNEGCDLHHCVGHYVNRIIEGSTNIMFIRKKEDTLKPFFTVEIDNSGVIRQVHGFGNRNADTEPGLVEYVNRWAKDRGLSLSDYDIIR